MTMSRTIAFSFVVVVFGCTASRAAAAPTGAAPVPSVGAQQQGTGFAIEAPVLIAVKRSQKTTDFAASELRKYMGRMAGHPDAAAVAGTGQEVAADLELGLFSDFGLSLENLDDPEKDDAIHVEVEGSRGIIAGSNPRSVLFAVYRFLEANGCRWLRPGKDGEIVPSREIRDLAGHISDKAFYRFRGNNNCCTYSLENVLDKIDWTPKVGLNTFFNEFSLPKHLYSRWYEHEWNNLKRPEPRSDDELRAYHEKSIQEIKRRGLIYHAYGHGWSGAALGLTDGQVNDLAFKITGDAQKYLALLNGERKTHPRGAIFTDLCYGNPEVRRKMVRAVADYAQGHPEVDMLHIWLGDAMNRHCECGLCRNTRPSDFYVMMLNAMDRELTQRGIQTRLVFLLYMDLLWPPEQERFRNPDRFVMMFAPIARTYNTAYDLEVDGSSLPSYVRNRNSNPTNIRENIAFLRAWQKLFSGESFVFDYHLIWFHHFDQGYFGVSEILAEDIRRLDKLGIDGFVSCQNLRAYLPTGYPMLLHARVLWNPQIDTDHLALKYFESAFGKEGGLTLEYMKELSRLFDAASTYQWRNREGSWTDTAVAQKLARVPTVVQEFRPVVERNLDSDDKAQALSWRHVFLHMELAELLSHALRARAEGKLSLANAYGNHVAEYLQVNEDRLQPVLDMWWFLQTMRRGGIFKLSPDKRGGVRR